MDCLLLNAGFDWKQLLLGEADWHFLIMVAIRTSAMFLVILVGLRLLGKRGIKQLSVFELGVIIGLGSAAGDPMFYKSVGLLACVIVFALVVILYHALKYTLDKNEKWEAWVEGKPVTIIQDGRLLIKKLKRETVAKAELFIQLRGRNISHLGQVKLAVLEPNGDVSTFFFEDKEVIYGLPILPDLYEDQTIKIEVADIYSCVNCSHTLELGPAKEHVCAICGHKKWVIAMNGKRMT